MDEAWEDPVSRLGDLRELRHRIEREWTDSDGKETVLAVLEAMIREDEEPN